MELKPLINTRWLLCSTLLIVPYGIETNVKQEICEVLRTFNRTLWN